MLTKSIIVDLLSPIIIKVVMGTWVISLKGSMMCRYDRISGPEPTIEIFVSERSCF